MQNSLGQAFSEEIHPSERVVYKITNIVSSADIGTKLDLNQISLGLPNVKTYPNRFPGICLNIKKPKCVVILFRNGKIVITGIKKANLIPIVIDRLREELKSIDIITSMELKYKIVNIVISADILKEINIDLACLSLDHCIYEPEVFPGLIFRMQEPVKCVFLLFSSGKFVITGLNCEENIEKAIITFGKELYQNKLFKNSTLDSYDIDFE
jgi:transcription initiation factor TFIID TATA-box-binding protein